jgi:hypothetical protein
MMVYVCLPTYLESINKRIEIQAGMGKNTRPNLKSNESKKWLRTWLKW